MPLCWIALGVTEKSNLAGAATRELLFQSLALALARDALAVDVVSTVYHVRSRRLRLAVAMYYMF